MRISLRSAFGITTLMGMSLVAATGWALDNPLRPARRQPKSPQAPKLLEEPVNTAVRSVVEDTIFDPGVAPAGGVMPAPPVGGVRPASHRHAGMGYGTPVPGTIIYDEEPALVGPGEEVMLDEHGHLVGSHGGCGTCTDGSCTSCLIPCPTLCFDNFQFMVGTQGFTGPANRGETGSFGFYYGTNWAIPMPCSVHGLGVQVGFRGTTSNFSGAESTDATRNQYFVTGGLFRRADWGLQGGVVVDYLHDNWYYQADLYQVRGELSWMYPQCHELGFWFTVGDDGQTVASDVNGQTINELLTPTDLFAFFYRRRFENFGQGRFYAGFTGESDGLLGADFQMPISECWALETNFTYLIPEESDGPTGFQEESWNVAVGLVWYPGVRNAFSQDYYRPLFNVADNGSFMVDRQ